MHTDHDNLYAAPKANLTTEESQQAPFYIVSQRKFWVLLMATLGMYQIYWFYKHFTNYRNATNEKMWPTGRAIFSIFFAHGLFAKFSEYTHQSTANTSLTYYATIYVVFVILSNITERVSEEFVGLGSLALAIASTVFIVIYGWAMSRAQAVANLAAGDAQGMSNHTLTPLNVFWIVLGILLWIMYVFATLYLAFPTEVDALFLEYIP